MSMDIDPTCSTISDISRVPLLVHSNNEQRVAVDFDDSQGFDFDDYSGDQPQDLSFQVGSVSSSERGAQTFHPAADPRLGL